MAFSRRSFFKMGTGAIVVSSIPISKRRKQSDLQKFKRLSSQNRKRLAKYWSDMLGYPEDYVYAMTKDFVTVKYEV